MHVCVRATSTSSTADNMYDSRRKLGKEKKKETRVKVSSSALSRSSTLAAAF